jgi:hypothetical protein
MRALRVAGLIALVAYAVVAPPAMAQTNECDPEETKFVEYPHDTYGNKTAVYAYDRAMSVWCGSVANTTFWALGNVHLDYIEGGTRQYADRVGSFKVFAAYSIFPAPYDYVEMGGSSNRQWVSFLVANQSGTSYTHRVQWGYGLVPSSYQTILVTPMSTANYGTPASEVSRYGHADVEVRASVDSMKYRTSANTWPYWTGLRCAPPHLNTIMDWDARKTSDHSWELVHGPILAGGC